MELKEISSHSAQFFVRTADADVERYLKLFTFLPLPKIQSIMDKHKAAPSTRIAQHTLAFEVLELIHGKEAAENTERQHRNLFRNSTLVTLTEDSTSTPAPATAETPGPTAPHVSEKLQSLLNHQNRYKREQGTFVSPQLNPYATPTTATNAPPKQLILPKSLIWNQATAKVLYSAGLVSSRSEGHRLAQNKGAYVGRRSSGKDQMADDLDFVPAKLNDPMQMWNYVIRDQEDGSMDKPGEEGLLVLRTGKWKVKVVRIVSDEVFEGMRLKDPPGWRELKAEANAQRNMEEWADVSMTRGGRKVAEGERWHARHKAMEYFANDANAENNAEERAEEDPGSGRLQAREKEVDHFTRDSLADGNNTPNVIPIRKMPVDGGEEKWKGRPQTHLQNHRWLGRGSKNVRRMEAKKNREITKLRF